MVNLEHTNPQINVEFHEGKFCRGFFTSAIVEAHEQPKCID